MIGNFYQGNKVNLGVFLVTLSLVLSGCETEEEAAVGHLEKGIQLLEKGNYAAAQLELKTAHKGNKSTAETYFYLALLDEKANHYLVMKDNLEKVLEIEPGHQKALVKLSTLELWLGEDDKAQLQVDKLLANNAEDSEALALKATILLRKQKNGDALGVIEEILQLDPTNVEGLKLKVNVFMRQDKLQKALALVGKGLSLDEKNIALHFLKIQIHAKQKNVEMVTDDYLSLIKLFPKNDDYKITLVKIYSQTGNVGEAEQILRQLIAKKPENIKPKILLLEFFSALVSDRLDQQISIFSQQLGDKPEQLLEISKWILSKNNTQGAKKLLQQLSDAQGETNTGIEAKIFLAKIAFDAENYGITKNIIGKILQKFPDNVESKLLKVRVLLIEEKYEEAKTFLTKVIWTHPKSDDALVLLAQFYLVQGDINQAHVKFKDALELNPTNIQAFIPIYNNLLANHDTKYARELLIKGLRKNPKQIVLLQKLIELNIQEENWKEANVLATRLKKVPVQKDLATFYLANILKGQGECAKAIDIYKQLVNDFPEQLQIFKHMSACYESLNKQSQMFSFLNAYIKSHSNNTAATMVLSDLYISVKKHKMAAELLNVLLQKQPEFVQVRQKLANIYSLLGKPKKVIALYEEGLQMLPGNIRLSLALTSIYQKQKMYDEAVRIYEQLHVQNPDLQVASNNLAILLVEHFNTHDNLLRASRLVDSFANSSEVYYKDTYAWVLLHKGNIEEAIKIFKEITLKSPNIPVFRYHLGVAEFKNENISNAMAQVAEALELGKQGKNFPEQKIAEEYMLKIVSKMRENKR